MGIDVNMVHQISKALAIGERNEINRKHPGSRDAKHETWGETNRKAAQYTIGILVLILLAKLLWSLLKFLGRLSIRLFGPKWGMIVNIVGLVLLIVIPACTMKMAADREEAEATARVEAQQKAEEEFRAKNQAVVEKYRGQVREKVKALSARCEDDAAVYTNVLELYERESKIVWKRNMSDWYVKDKVDRAYNSCVDYLDLRDEKRIYEYFSIKATAAYSVCKEVASELRKIKQYDLVGKAEYAREEFVHRHEFSREGIRLHIAYSVAKKKIDVDYEKCVNGIREILQTFLLKQKVEQHIKERKNELMAFAKKDVHNRYAHYLEEFDRRVVSKSLGGDIDFTGSFEEIKVQVDKEYQSTMEKMKLAMQQHLLEQKVEQYIKERKNELTAFAKKDVYRRCDYYLGEFDRRVVSKSLGGDIDFTGSFEDIKEQVDKEYQSAMEKMKSAMQK